MNFPKGALQKRIKIGLQLQKVPPEAVRLLDRTEGVVDAYPLIGIYPRRRKFHSPIEVSVPVISQNRFAFTVKEQKKVKKRTTFCHCGSAVLDIRERAVLLLLLQNLNDKGTSLPSPRVPSDTHQSFLFSRHP